MDAPLPFFTRLWLALSAWLRIVFDGAFAARVAALDSGTAAPSLEAAEAAAPPPEPQPRTVTETPGAARDMAASVNDGALQLLALLQREGRLIDFLQQDIASFPDADVGAAARVVHAGCRRALAAHADVKSVRSEAEGARVSVSAEEARRVKLVGNVSGAAPYRGVLRHRGWRVEGLRLPTLVGEQDLAVVAQAEVEL